MGMTLRELIYGEAYGGGIKDGKKLKAVAPSGASGGFLPARLTVGAGLPQNRVRSATWQQLAERHGVSATADELDTLELELELNVFRGASPTQALGAGLVVYAEDRNVASEAVNALEFFRNESCGKCVPCRIGSQKLATLGRSLLAGRIGGDRWRAELVPLIKELADVMTDSSICGLGRAVRMPLNTLIDFFEPDLLPYLGDGMSGPTQTSRDSGLSKR
jgi:NADH:ubiquinone oxidoreductase subunit F (NADH-binding)